MSDPNWYGLQDGHTDLLNWLVGLGLDHLAEVEGVAAADQARAAFDAGEYVGGIEHGLAVLRVGSGERVLVSIPLEELQATLDLLYPRSDPS